MIRTATLLGALLAGALFAGTLEELSKKPDGHVKNFLIWQYLQQEDITGDEAERAFSQLYNVNQKLYLAYAERSEDPYVKETARCWQLSASDMAASADDACVMMALSPGKVAALEPKQRKALAERFAQKPEFGPWLKVMAEIGPGTDLERFDPELFVKVAGSAGTSYRRELLDRDYTKAFIGAIAKQRGFDSLVRRVVTDDKMVRFQRALLETEPGSVKAETAFFLALNQLRHGDKEAALRCFERAYDTFYYRMDKDKAIFWQFLVSKDPQLLRLLAQSVDINIYSLYAKELLDERVDNYFITLNTSKDAKPKIDITDPFEWERLLETIRKTPKEQLFATAEAYRSRPLLPVQAFILERAYGYKMYGYITPYKEAMRGMDKEKKAMMLSLMRQESHFIPSALSRSYAMGLMQMMPFLVRAMDKEAKRPTGSLEKMFDPDTNIAYASKHLDYLQQYLYHPLLIAYAYNGGIGFTKRMLLGGAFSQGDYEPFWSMEMMANSESREYGKKVLANYVVYERIFGNQVSIARLFDNLKHPSLSDRFRASK